MTFDTELSPLRTAIQPYLALGRPGLLPALHAAQRTYGWISEPVAAEIARALHVPLADVHGVIEFYTLFNNKPMGRRVIRVCTDLACALQGGEGVLDHLCAQHSIQPGQTNSDGTLTVESSPCLGLCEQAPAALVNDQAETSIHLAGNSYELGRPRSIVGGSLRLLTANCGHGTTSFEGHGEYSALRKALTMTPAAVVEEVKAAGLVGRGGAAFPTGNKWEGAAAATGSPKYVVCKADEPEPGTFKDRVLLLDDPHTLIEGMVIAAYAIGSTEGYIYLRGEYPYIQPVLDNALAEARANGLLGQKVLGSSFSFDIQVRLGAGAYAPGAAQKPADGARSVLPASPGRRTVINWSRKSRYGPRHQPPLWGSWEA